MHRLKLILMMGFTFCLVPLAEAQTEEEHAEAQPTAVQSTESAPNANAQHPNVEYPGVLLSPEDLFQKGGTASPREADVTSSQPLSEDTVSDNAEAMMHLGIMYLRGDGVAKDDAKGVQWFQRAAALGNAKAQYRLGTLYEDGIGVDADKQKAIEWYTKAAEQNDSDAQIELGILYYTGDGVKQDVAKGIAYLKLAAKNGNPRSRRVIEQLERF